MATLLTIVTRWARMGNTTAVRDGMYLEMALRYDRERDGWSLLGGPAGPDDAVAPAVVPYLRVHPEVAGSPAQLAHRQEQNTALFAARPVVIQACDRTDPTATCVKFYHAQNYGETEFLHLAPCQGVDWVLVSAEAEGSFLPPPVIPEQQALVAVGIALATKQGLSSWDRFH